MVLFDNRMSKCDIIALLIIKKEDYLMAPKDPGCDFRKFVNYEDSDDFYLYELGRNKCTPLYSYEHCVKNRIILHIIIKGQGILRTNNKQYDIHQGQIFLIPENQRSFYQADQDNPWEYIWFVIGGPKIPLILKEAGLTPDYPVYTPVAGSAEIKNLAMDTLKNYKRQYYCIGNLYKICDFMIENSSRKEDVSISNSLIYVKNAISYIQLKYSEPVRIEHIASSLGLNRSYLTRLFKDATGYSLQDYLLTYRMKIAVKLLADNSLCISQIAKNVGYCDTFTFSKAFKRHFGKSPSEYRKK